MRGLARKRLGILGAQVALHADEAARPARDSSGSSCASDNERLLSLGCAARPDQASATRGDGSLSSRGRHLASDASDARR